MIINYLASIFTLRISYFDLSKRHVCALAGSGRILALNNLIATSSFGISSILLMYIIYPFPLKKDFISLWTIK